MSKDIKDEIKKYYGGLASEVTAGTGEAPCCCCKPQKSQILYDDEYLEDLPEEALKASIGCANPIFLANIQPGETVLDLGSGGGIDVLISAKYAGETGKVYGLDMTDEMLDLANENKQRSGRKNVEFIKGYIEDIPLDNDTVDVVTSNCVINLSEDKSAVLREAYRVIRPGGRVAIADVIELKKVEADLRKNAQLWVGCISGALSIEEYTQKLEDAGFKNVEITVVDSYTKEFLREFAQNKGLSFDLSDEEANELDNAFASAYVKAYK
ncbi:MAG: arsenite methyltransferase [Christensenella sp.]|uniref:arsenite methyltransferase n=1 Tax=Christensenella sp. TaxID=1935934 RepID=UPI002B21D4A9|nr:arsenite methyltransferase [Christensenella sp.]MEA5003240.1 arsenite methyltransferase [Christensenella sp.]